MTSANVLQVVTQALERAGIPYMLTGSYASNYYGMPRATQDIDFVISASPEQLKDLTQQLHQQGYFAEVEDALEAWRHQSMFNVIEPSYVWKIDFIMRKPGVFSRQAFQRRIPGEVDGIPVHLTTAEDLVIAKLDWAKQGESYRQLEDVARVFKIRWDSLDRAYITRWVTELALTPQWETAKKIAGLE